MDESDSRGAIKQLAEELLVRHGFRGMSFADIAERRGITRANIHYHFGSKAALIDEVLADYTSTTLGSLRQVWESESTSLLQKQIKYGLTDRAAIAFHEAGFADRYVASTLGLVWGDVVDRDGVRAACQQEEIVRAVLAHIPSYFVGVAAELGGWA